MKTFAVLLLFLLMTGYMYGQHKTLSLQYIDSSIKPGDDFYMYANGKWYDTATIPPTESRVGARMDMDYTTRANIKNILEQAAAAHSAPGTITQKVGDLFASGMDTVAIERRGYQPVQKLLDEINALKNGKDVMHFVAEQYTLYNTLLIGLYVAADDKNSMSNLLQFYQAGLGLPDRDYYFKTDASTQDVVKAYQTYIIKLFMLTGDDAAQANKHMNIVYELEKQMAASHRTNVELRDPQTNYNKMAVADLDKQWPFIGWKELMVQLHANVDSVNLGQPGYYAKLDTLLQTVPVETWKTYLRFHVLDNVAPLLSKDFVTANFEYTGRALRGQKEIKPRWERMYNLIDGILGEALGQLYVEKYFTPESKQKITELVNNLQKAFAMRIDKLDWMSDSTKLVAKEKLATFIKSVGYPDKWRDYSRVTINRNNFLENVTACSENEYYYMISKLGKPVDRTEWGMTPPTDNAYYSDTHNKIVFPAGILLFPMFDLHADDALNYGGIGVVIGHEMTHGFDDEGAQYDKQGNLNNWWSKEDYEKFKAKGVKIVEQYNSFTVFDTMHVNGALTEGENTADMGGVAIAYTAFKLTKEGQDTAKIDGLTPDQRFFLAFAQSWRKKITDQALQQQVKTDPHSPGFFRVKGPLMNFTPFYTAFNVQPGDKMYKRENERITIW
jgi:putative endopeptidase